MKLNEFGYLQLVTPTTPGGVFNKTNPKQHIHSTICQSQCGHHGKDELPQGVVDIDCT